MHVPTAIATNSLSGGHLLVKCLLSLGATTCFGVPGESYLDVLDGLHETQGQLDFVLCRNEGGAAFMAEAYGKLNGSPGICMVTRGPGATNASIGVHTAMQNSTPMILFIGQIGTDMRDREVFQEVDYRAFYGSVAKWVVEIDHADRIPELISRAWSTALSGRPGPVVVSLPENMLTDRSTVKACKPVVIAEPALSQQNIDEAVALLNRASKPLVLVGGCGWTEKGRESLQHFALQNNLPVATAFRFNDIIDNDSPCYIGNAGVFMAESLQSIISTADAILAIGVRFGEMTTRQYSLLNVPHPEACLIHAHASAAELGKIYAADLPLNAGSNQVVQQLRNVNLSGQWHDWLTGCRQSYIDSFNVEPQPGPVDMASVIAWLDEQLPDDAIVTSGAGNFAAWPNKYIRFHGRRRLLAPQSGAMGYGLPAAVAAKINNRERMVVCFAGDGDFQMNCQELGTAMQAHAQPIVLILNNGSYSTIRMHQEKHYPDRVSATDIVNPDFVALAQSYGYYAERVENSGDFAGAFERAVASKTGAVLELITSVEAINPLKTLAQIRGS